MRARVSPETLAPGVNARDTAERDTPARRATSAAVTNPFRKPLEANRTASLHTCAGSILAPVAHACKTRRRGGSTAENLALSTVGMTAPIVRVRRDDGVRAAATAYTRGIRM
jgi:hypothetical protein